MLAVVIGIILVIGGVVTIASVVRYWRKMDEHFRSMGVFMTIMFVTFGVMLIRA